MPIKAEHPRATAPATNLPSPLSTALRTEIDIAAPTTTIGNDKPASSATNLNQSLPAPTKWSFHLSKATQTAMTNSADGPHPAPSMFEAQLLGGPAI
ncbi:hypothetical protein AERO9AM_10260 [Aeromicrobium sp. 9AM]|nr:hypothetical protein AERO9AM_10260 [Aeromicrobium sp. 9AM]